MDTLGMGINSDSNTKKFNQDISTKNYKMGM